MQVQEANSTSPAVQPLDLKIVSTKLPTPQEVDHVTWCFSMWLQCAHTQPRMACMPTCPRTGTHMGYSPGQPPPAQCRTGRRHPCRPVCRRLSAWYPSGAGTRQTCSERACLCQRTGFQGRCTELGACTCGRCVASEDIRVCCCIHLATHGRHWSLAPA